VAYSLGTNSKARLAARAVFTLSNRHGDIVREGWRNILELLLPLFRANLLPDEMVCVEDFVDPSGQIPLVRQAELTIFDFDKISIFTKFSSRFVFNRMSNFNFCLNFDFLSKS